MNSKEVGKLGEDIAVKYLQEKGYQILDRNFKRKISPFLKSEIDIVARKKDLICFVEVKTLLKSYSGPQFFSPEEKVDFKKKRKLIRTAEAWLLKRKIPLDSKWQIDILAIEIDSHSKKAKISHFKNAISL